MKKPDGFPCHDCAPKAWRKIPNITGDYDMDAAIMHSHNRDMAGKIMSHLSTPHYGPKTGYNGYGSGDD